MRLNYTLVSVDSNARILLKRFGIPWNREVLLADVNVLVYAHREDVADHTAYRAWLESVVNGDEAYGISELVLSGFVRVVTHAKVFNKPSPLE